MYHLGESVGDGVGNCVGTGVGGVGTGVGGVGDGVGTGVGDGVGSQRFFPLRKQSQLASEYVPGHFEQVPQKTEQQSPTLHVVAAILQAGGESATICSMARFSLRWVVS
jgi:hypothetical protein